MVQGQVVGETLVSVAVEEPDSGEALHAHVTISVIQEFVVYPDWSPIVLLPHTSLQLEVYRKLAGDGLRLQLVEAS